MPVGSLQVRKSIIGFDVPGLNTSTAWEAGFGSLYWMEGVVTRQRDRHGGERACLPSCRLPPSVCCRQARALDQGARPGQGC